MSVGSVHTIQAAAHEIQKATSETEELNGKVEKVIQDLELFENSKRDGFPKEIDVRGLMAKYGAASPEKLSEKIYASIASMIRQVQQRKADNDALVQKGESLKPRSQSNRVQQIQALSLQLELSSIKTQNSVLEKYIQRLGRIKALAPEEGALLGERLRAIKGGDLDKASGAPQETPIPQIPALLEQEQLAERLERLKRNDPSSRPLPRHLNPSDVSDYVQAHIPPGFFSRGIPFSIVEALPKEYLSELSPHVLKALDPKRWSKYSMFQPWVAPSAEFANALSEEVYDLCSFDQLATLTPEELDTLEGLGAEYVNHHAKLLGCFSLERFLAFEPKIVDRLRLGVLNGVEPEILNRINPKTWNEFTDEMFELLDATFLNKLGIGHIEDFTKDAFDYMSEPSASQETKGKILSAFNPKSLDTFFDELPKKIAQRAAAEEQKEIDDETKKLNAYFWSLGLQGTTLTAVTTGVGSWIGFVTKSAAAAGAGSAVGQGLSQIGLQKAGHVLLSASATPLNIIVILTSGVALMANALSLARQIPTWGPAEWAACGIVSSAAVSSVVIFAPAYAGLLGLSIAGTTAASMATFPASKATRAGMRMVSRLSRRVGAGRARAGFWRYTKQAAQYVKQAVQKALSGNKKRPPEEEPGSPLAKRQRLH